LYYCINNKLGSQFRRSSITCRRRETHAPYCFLYKMHFSEESLL